MGSGQVLWTCTGRNKTPPPSTSLPVMGDIAGVNTASLGGYLHSSKKRASWAEGFHDEFIGHVFDLERDGLCQVVLAQDSPYDDNTQPYYTKPPGTEVSCEMRWKNFCETTTEEGHKVFFSGKEDPSLIAALTWKI